MSDESLTSVERDRLYQDAVNAMQRIAYVFEQYAARECGVKGDTAFGFCPLAPDDRHSVKA